MTVELSRREKEEFIEQIKKLVDEAYKDAEIGMDYVRRSLKGCSLWMLSIGLGDVADSFGRVLTIKQLCKELGIRIPYEIEKKMDEIIRMHWKAYRLRDEFHHTCECTVRE